MEVIQIGVDVNIIDVNIINVNIVDIVISIVEKDNVYIVVDNTYIYNHLLYILQQDVV
jgi:hypothetical protein